MPKTVACCVVAALAFALSSAKSADAFVCIHATPDPNSPCVHWASGATTLRSLLGNASRTLLNGTTTWDQNVQMAANDWTGVGAEFHYDLAFGGQLNDPCTADGRACAGTPGDNEVFFTDHTCNNLGFGDIVAQTTNCFNTSNGELITAPVFVNQNAPFNAYDGRIRPGVNDMRRVLLHEFGHVLGLDHPDVAGQTVSAIMNSQESDIDRLQDDDRAGLFSLYRHNAEPTVGCQVHGGATDDLAWLLLLPLALASTRRRPKRISYLVKCISQESCKLQATRCKSEASSGLRLGACSSPTRYASRFTRYEPTANVARRLQ